MSSTPVIPADARGIERAAAAIGQGRLVGMPTETVYGLAADATSAAAVAELYAVKGRPAFNPLIAHVASLAMARREGRLDDRATALAETFWPGPLTLVVPAASTGQTAELARAGLATIALRVPAHPAARALLAACGRPLAAPSANPSGRLSPTRSGDVAAEMPSGVALVLEGGASTAGIESTIVGVIPGEPLRLLRAGAIARERIETGFGPLDAPQADAVSAPGQLASHYAPVAELRLNAQDFADSEAVLGFGPGAPDGALNLSSAGDTQEAAANLYQCLRRLDASGTQRIAVMPIPEHGLGEAINDRLRRAAAPRDG
ncbi:MAG: L-threonylcarbamoyladenylate synthase [Pseudomonadota bacterium]